MEYNGYHPKTLLPPDRPYQAGQIWRYKTRPGEEGSRLYIVKIEVLPSAGATKIYHLYVDGLRIVNPCLSGGMQTTLQHLPVGQETLNQSVDAYLGTAEELPDISEGYQTWKALFEAGESGYFTLPIAKIAQCVEDAIVTSQSL